MKTKDIFATKKFVMSAEVFPPKKSGTIEGVVRALRDIQKANPDFVSITYGAGGSGAETTADVASIAIDAFGLNTVAHMTAVNMTRTKLIEQLEILDRKGIDNILVLRGDIAENSKFIDFHHANELAQFVKAVAPSFNLIGACYPEKHPESKTIEEDIDNLKLKVDSGVSHLITQMFFDNNKFYDFVDKALAKGITVPIDAGIMPIVNSNQVPKMVYLSNAQIPSKLTKMIDDNINSPDFYNLGMDYACEQIDDLIKHGCRGVHIYTMNRGDIALKIFDRFREERG
ncbi:MAG TPA: methylenetetrahydrofolate reductase [Clostridia bacterium]|nr:methylenetetrahydrofolate reductase [Clostridia bacterium]